MARLNRKNGAVGLIAISIVSHAHGAMVARLVSACLDLRDVSQVIVTKNTPEILKLPVDRRLLVIENSEPKGFGRNHNMAFARCDQPYFCLLNPDIELRSNLFSDLLKSLQQHRAAVVTPIVRDGDGNIEDSIRRFPTVFSLLSKACGGPDGRYAFTHADPAFYPDWFGGMFMLFRSEDFRRLQGFDEKFFLYYEDVDICVRAWKAGMKVLACPSVSVIHNAQRASRRDFRHMKWHAASMLRYFWKHAGRLPKVS